MRHETLIAVAVLCVGCSSGDGRSAAPADTAGRDTADVAGAPRTAVNRPVARPETREDTIMIEGMPEVERVRLVRSPPDFAVPFSTYVPGGMQAEFRTAGAGAVRFSAAFGGTPNPAAYMHVQFHAPGAPEPAVSDVVRAVTAAAAEARPAGRPSWALDARRFTYRGTDGVRIAGSVMTGEHAGRYFHVIVHYPEEYADGMGPRTERILRHWRWQDDGEPLVP